MANAIAWFVVVWASLLPLPTLAPASRIGLPVFQHADNKGIINLSAMGNRHEIFKRGG